MVKECDIFVCILATPAILRDPQYLKIIDLSEKIENNKMLLSKNFSDPDNFRKTFYKNLGDWWEEYKAENLLNNVASAPVDPVIKGDKLEMLDGYRRWVIDRCQKLDLNNLTDNTDVIQVNLPEIFIPLYTDPIDKNKWRYPAP